MIEIILDHLILKQII